MAPSSTSPPGVLGPGSRVGGEFTIVAPLDEGGMGAVYVAEQASTGKRRALKLMHREIVADPAFKRRFEQEAKVGARIRSEHVVEVLAAGVDEASGGLPFLVMELLEGQDLRHHLRTRGTLPAAEVRTLFEQLCHAMAAAHEAGVVHRDLKPENVFLARSLRAGAASFVVKVLDFGIAKIQAEAGTRATRGAVGSPLWMAPEQTSPGPVTPAADVWALGLMAYELLTGHSFWRAATAEGGTTAQLLREIVLDPIPPASGRAREQGTAEKLPAAFDAWFARSVAREPLHRFAEAGAQWRALAGVLDGTAVSVDLGATGAPRDAFAETAAASELTPLPPAASAPPTPLSPRLSGETPLESAREVPRVQPAPRASYAVLALGAALGAAGVGVGVYLSRTPPAGPVVTAPPSSAGPVVGPTPAIAIPASAQPSATALASAAPPPPPPPTSAAITAAVVPSASGATSGATSGGAAAAATAPAKRVAVGPAVANGNAAGFADPGGKPVTWKAGEHRVRLLTRLVKNDSNVTDATVKHAVEWNSWSYLQCYERAFGAAKDAPEGVVTVGFDILDQLPRHGTLVSSTVGNERFDSCVVQTLIGQTINAAGPDGRGHVAYAFRFVPN